MERWLKAALDYIPQWIDLQMRALNRPGCSIAIVERGRVILEQAFGSADLSRNLPLTPRHRFRVASHSKAFTVAAILKLREQGRLQLDDRIGRYVDGLHPKVARVTIQQLLTHSAGIVRDGADTGQWQDRRPFLSEAELRADLAGGPAITPNSRFKYSNHGYGLLGLAIAAITGEDCNGWMLREIVQPAGLAETLPDMPLPRGVKMARGHSGTLLLGRRLIVPGDNRTNAMAPATGFVATAADVARFFNQLDPGAKKSLLSAESRREMVRRQWRQTPGSPVETWYGLGVDSGTLNGWPWFGHAGGFQGFISRTTTLPELGLTIAILTNSTDGVAQPWVEGIIHILQLFRRHGAPKGRATAWNGRWWSKWGAIDLVPAGTSAFLAVPALWNPFAEASRIEPTGRDTGRIAEAGGLAHFGEPCRLVRNARGTVTEVWLAGTRFLPEARLAAEMQRMYRPAGPPAGAPVRNPVGRPAAKRRRRR